MGRLLKTKIAAPISPARGKIHEEAKLQDERTLAHRKQLRDQTKKAVTKAITPGDKVLIRQQKTTTKSPFDPKPYTVIKVNGTQITAARGTQTKVRNIAKYKLLTERPSHLEIRRKEQTNHESSDDDNIHLAPTENRPEHCNARQEAVIGAAEREVVEQAATQPEDAQHPNEHAAGDCRRFSSRTGKQPERYTPVDWRR